ncbi:hypothetical protein [Moritella sp.]
MEVIIVDDGSTDARWKWICQLCRKHNNIIAKSHVQLKHWLVI